MAGHWHRLPSFLTKVLLQTRNKLNRIDIQKEAALMSRLFLNKFIAMIFNNWICKENDNKDELF